MRHALLLAGFILSAAASPSWAQAPGAVIGSDTLPSDTLASAAPAAAPPDQAPVPNQPTANPLSAEEMSDLKAGSETQVLVLTNQELSGTTSGNTITAGALSSGQVNFSAQSLSGFAGVGNFVVNTGANNTLQGAINISIVAAPAP